MAKSRTKKALMNVGTGLAYEGVKLACGLILPRLILSNFGSAYNGIVSSITQFVQCIALMKAGIGGATKAALYKPLADKDNKEISEVVISTEKFMQKVAILFLCFVAIFAFIYPTFINSDFEFWFTATLIIIVSISTFGEYFFGYTYQLLLMSDQKEYLLTGLGILTTILDTIVAVVLINGGFGIHVIKIGSVAVSLIAPIFLYIYVRKKYRIDYSVKPDMSKISQRWDAVAHEVATFVNNNTDIMVLTIFTNLLEVSVYTVYHYVVYNIKKLIKSSVSNFASAFGDMYAKGEYDLIEENLGVFELIINSIVSIVHSTTLVMIVPFVMLYTNGVTDVNYARPLYAVIAVVASAFDCFRMPYKVITTAIGHFKQTRNGAIFEAVLNIVLSCLLVRKYGLIGVAIGTLAAMMFRTIQYSVYLSKNVLNRSLKPFIMHILLSLGTIALVYIISTLYMPKINSWLLWIIYSIITVLIAMLITLATDYFIYKKDFMNLLTKVLKTFRKA